MRSAVVGIIFLIIMRLTAHELWSMKSYEDYCENWTPWGRCNACNGGRRHRQRLCPYPGNYYCGSPDFCFADHQIGDCFEPCSSFGPWSCWKFCSKVDAKSHEIRNRTCDFINGPCSDIAEQRRDCPIDVCLLGLRWFQWKFEGVITTYEALRKTTDQLITDETEPGAQGATPVIDIITLLPFPVLFTTSVVVFWTTLKPSETDVYSFTILGTPQFLSLEIHNGSSIKDPVISSLESGQASDRISLEKDCIYLLRSRSFVPAGQFFATIIDVRSSRKAGFLDVFEDVCFKPSPVF